MQRFEREEAVRQVPARQHRGLDAPGGTCERHFPVGMELLHRVRDRDRREEMATGAATCHQDGGRHLALAGLPRRLPMDTSTPADTR